MELKVVKKVGRALCLGTVFVVCAAPRGFCANPAPLPTEESRLVATNSPQAAASHQHGVYSSATGNNVAPLPLTSNAGNQPLLPGNERVDYSLQPYVQGQPLVLMAISGGGSRSAYYAARVMEELAGVPLPGIKENPPLPDGRPLYSLLDSVRIISTVSAGDWRRAGMSQISNYVSNRISSQISKKACPSTFNGKHTVTWRCFLRRQFNCLPAR